MRHPVHADRQTDHQNLNDEYIEKPIRKDFNKNIYIKLRLNSKRDCLNNKIRSQTNRELVSALANTTTIHLSSDLSSHWS